MSESLSAQTSMLARAVKYLEPLINRLHTDFDAGRFPDWPTVLLATTVQTTAVSTLTLLPRHADATAILDMRSIATLVRNLVDTFDALEMLVDASSQDESELHRNILGLYLASRTGKVQNSVVQMDSGDFLSDAKAWYWERIKQSPLYSQDMKRLKDGEHLFYRSRRERVEAVCGDDADFVSAVLTELSTFVHSVPPRLWMADLDTLYSNHPGNRDVVAVWVRVTCFYVAHCINLVFKATRYSPSDDFEQFLSLHKTVFA